MQSLKHLQNPRVCESMTGPISPRLPGAAPASRECERRKRITVLIELTRLFVKLDNHIKSLDPS